MTSHIKSQMIEAFNTDNLYEVFNLDQNASEADIKKSFRKLALIHHPDKGGNETKFKALCVAYGILSDNEKRQEYDRSGLEGKPILDDDCQPVIINHLSVKMIITLMKMKLMKQAFNFGIHFIVTYFLSLQAVILTHFVRNILVQSMKRMIFSKHMRNHLEILNK